MLKDIENTLIMHNSGSRRG